MFFIKRARTNSPQNKAMVMTASIGLALAANTAFASPASDRAFGNCVSAAAAYLEIRGHHIGNVTVLARDADQHRLRITPASVDAEPAAIICTASRQTTSIEAVPARLAVTNTAR